MPSTDHMVPNSILTVPYERWRLCLNLDCLPTSCRLRFRTVCGSACREESHPLLTNLCACPPVASIEGTSPATRRGERHLNIVESPDMDARQENDLLSPDSKSGGGVCCANAGGRGGKDVGFEIAIST